MEKLRLYRGDGAILAALGLIALGLRLGLLIAHPFDGLYGQDSYAYYDFARQLQIFQPGQFFWPWGYSGLLAVSFALFGSQAQNGQFITLLMGAALAPLTYGLARQVGSGRPGAAAAGLLMAICGQAVQSSLVLMADVPALFWALLSAVALLHARHTGRTRWLILAALLLGLAAITRWLYLILALPWLASILRTRRFRWRDLLAAGLIGGLLVGGQIMLGQLSGSPGLQHYDIDQWDLAHTGMRAFDNPDGHFEYATINAVYYAQPIYDSYYLAPVFVPFLLVGLWFLIRQRAFAVSALLIGWVLLPYLFLIGIPLQNIRFPLIVFPAVAVLAGIGLESASRILSATPMKRFAPALMIALLLAGSSMTLNASQDVIVPFILQQQNDKAVAAWASQQIPTDATLYTFGLTLTLKHYTSLDVWELFYETPESLAKRWIPGKDDYLLVNVWVIENQWAGLGPQIDYHWLRNTRGLDRLSIMNNYTLFRVHG